MRLLESIHSPKDLKALSPAELEQLCAEIRTYIIDCCAQNPGHLGSSLGCVELCVALHYVFDLPQDKLIFDVGHQAYAHKILTGRREAFRRNRCLDGISGFPSMKESPYDSFGAGHASTSISAALGLAVAGELEGHTGKIVAVIGDGSMTGGLAYEGLNNAGARKTDMLVILNDNQMSISPNVGGIHRHLLQLTTSARYNRIKQKTWTFLGASRLRWAVQKMVKLVKKGFMPHGTLFQELGFRYFGPVDGHKVGDLIKVLQRLKQLQGPKLLHILTTKGKGYAPAEADPSRWHAPGRFDAQTGALPSASGKLRFQDVFGRTLVELAARDPRIVGVTPAMLKGSSLDLLMQAYPARCFDVGIAEQHAVTFSAGMAAGGLLPFCNIYSSFMQRAYDGVIHDVALQGLKVIFCLDRGGLVGEDGPTHHGAFDLAYMRPVPGLAIFAPMDEYQLRDILFSVTDASYGATVIRYPRGAGLGLTAADLEKLPYQYIDIGKARALRTVDRAGLGAVLSLGPVGLRVQRAVETLAAQGVEVEHFDMRFLKPLDEEVLARVCARASFVLTVEDGCLLGGLHEAVCAYVAERGLSLPVRGLGLADAFVPQGGIGELYQKCGLDEKSIFEAILQQTSQIGSVGK